MKPKVAFVMFSVPNPRFIKRIKTASECGNVTVIYQVRTQNPYFIDQEILKGFNTTTYSSNSRDGHFISTLISFLKLTRKYLSALIQFRPDVIHASNILGTLIACFYLAFHDRNVKIIQEVGDINKYLIDSARGVKKLFQGTMRLLDRYLLKYCSLLIVTSEAFYEEYYVNHIPREKVLYLPNEPELSVFNNFKKKSKGIFTVGFIGSVRYHKQLETLIQAAKSSNIRVFIAGEGISSPYLMDKYKDESFVEFYGKYDYDKEIKELYQRVDCIYSVYDTSKKNVRLALPNRLYEAVTCRLPLIVAKNTRLAEVVEDWEVGLAVKDGDVNELKSVINNLKNDEQLSIEMEKNYIEAKEKFIYTKNNRTYQELLISALNN